MALVTIRRPPSLMVSPDEYETDGTPGQDEEAGNEKLGDSQERSISECYFAVKGAALVLPQNECTHVYRKNNNTNRDDIQQHLQSMFHLLRSDDTLKMAVKLESLHVGRTRYLVVVSCIGRQSTEESCLLGIDCNDEASIGLVLPVWVDTQITLDGDGGFSVSSSTRHHIFKPVSVQAMWSALQTLHKASSKARVYNYFMGGLTHSWIDYYEAKIHSDRSCLNEWHAMDDLESRRPPSPDSIRLRPSERESTENFIRVKLKEIMMSVDLDEVTSKYIRGKLEEDMNMDLNEYKSFIDQEMIVILGQMDAATEIFDYLYLGSEWNASNLEELQKNGICHILNVTREIDNFFPGMFEYLNVRVYDEEGTELLRHWDKTYKFIDNAKKNGSKVLVHCKMGVSRSASVVIAYAMKAYDWSMQRALKFIKSKRTCVKPNSGFMKQLETYQGILDASKQRHNQLWRSKSETNLKSPQQDLVDHANHKMTDPEPNPQLALYVESPSPSHRPKSWSPEDNVVDMLFDEGNSGDCYQVDANRQKCDDGGIIIQARNKHMLLPGLNGQAYSVSQNKVLHLPIKADQPCDKCYSPPNSAPCDKVTFTIGDGDDSPVYECRNPLYVDNVTEDTVVTQVPPLQRVSSIKDRINELESQALQGDQRGNRDQLDLPEIRGLVLNLANQFESASKPNTPSPGAEEVENEPNVDLFATVGLEESAPAVSQTKMAPPKHQAVLVKSETWLDGGRSKTRQNEGAWEESSLGGSDGSIEVKKFTDDLVMKLRVNGNHKSSCSSTPKNVILRPDNDYLPVRKDDPFSTQVDQVFDNEEQKCNTVNGISSTTSNISPSRQNSWGSSDSAIVMPQRESPSRHSSWGSVDSRQANVLSRESSWSSADCRHFCLGMHQKRTGRRASDSVTDSQHSSPGVDVRFPPLFTEHVIGLSRKVTEMQASPVTLKRTNSFDGAFIPTEEETSSEVVNSTLPSPIQRSQSLRVSDRSVGAKMTPNFRLHAPTPYRNPVDKIDKRRLSLQNQILHCASFPSLLLNSNSNLYPTHASSQPNMESVDVSRRNQLKLDFGGAVYQPEEEFKRVPGIVSQHRNALENRLSTVPVCLSNEEQVSKDKIKRQNGGQQQNAHLSPEDDTSTLGKVKRLTKEIESKVSTSPPKKNKTVIVDQKSEGEVVTLEKCLSPVDTMTINGCDDKSVRSLVGKFEMKDPHRTRYHSENDVDNSSPDCTGNTPPTISKESDLHRKSIGLASTSTWKSDEGPSTNGNASGNGVCLNASVSTKSQSTVNKLPPHCASGVGVVPRRSRKSHGKSHPLNKLMSKRHPNPLYNTM